MGALDRGTTHFRLIRYARRRPGKGPKDGNFFGRPPRALQKQLWDLSRLSGCRRARDRRASSHKKTYSVAHALSNHASSLKTARMSRSQVYSQVTLDPRQNARLESQACSVFLCTSAARSVRATQTDRSTSLTPH